MITKYQPLAGRQRIYEFANGFSASVINDGYGKDRGLFEIAVMRDGHLDYGTPITDDVLGYLTWEQVEETLDRIAALSPGERAPKPEPEVEDVALEAAFQAHLDIYGGGTREDTKRIVLAYLSAVTR